jgi:hypothetical protein
MTDSSTQWYSISVGGPMAPTSMIVHAACGAVIADRRRHEQVCTAPPMEPAESEVGRVRDWFNGGRRA